MPKTRRLHEGGRAVIRYLAGRAPRGWRLALLLPWLVLLPLGLARAEDPWAPFDAPWFDRLGVSDGLPHSITTALAQDERQLVWIGTMAGLVRYDGYRMQVFTATGNPAYGLPDAYVRSLLALPDGSLLIGTNAGGLSRFDPADNRFHNYPVGKDGTSDGKIYALARDGDSGAWIATERGLDHLDLRSNRITAVPTGNAAAPRNFSVLQDHAGNLWLGNNLGLFVRYVGSHAFVRPRHPAGDIHTVLSDGIWALHEDREGRLWVGSTRSGAAYRDADGRWQAVGGFSGYRQDGERHPTVRDFLELNADTLWLGTDGDGVLAYTPGSDHVRPMLHDTAMPSSLPGNAVRALLQDHAGNVWVATDLGVARHDPDARTAFALLPSSHDERTLANTNVRGIYVDTRGRIWLGMSAGHIDVIDVEHGVIRHLQLGGSQTRRDVQAFHEMPDGAIWVGTQGLARISPDTLAVQDSAIPALDDKPVLHLLGYDRQLLIATYDGVYRYDTRTRALAHIGHDPNDPGSLASNTVRAIERIGNAVWYLTSHGISIAGDAMQNHGFRNVLNQPDDPSSLPNNLVSSIASDPQGALWIGTYGGLALLESHAPGEPFRFRTIGVPQGLSSENINAVQSDDQGNAWVSLPNGISRIDGTAHVARNLGSRDGLRIASYIYAATARAPSGELLFGGLGGLTVVRPDWRPPDRPDAPLAITYATLNGQPLPFARLPRAGETLRLGPHSRSLRLDFALLDYQAPAETSYSYRMMGFDEEWTEVPHGSLPSVIYTNLPHGDYALQLRAQTHGMEPRAIMATIGIAVEPRWYETLTALVAGGLLLLAALAGVTQLRTLYLRRQARQLQQQIDAHTRDLLSANQRLDELASTDELTGLCNRRRFLQLAEEVRGQAADGNACVALLDLDHFKQINDTYGHLAGDAVIRTAGRIVREQCREGDLAGRYGGEELVACLPGTTLAQGMEVAERIRRALAASPVVHEGQSIAMTASIGVAAWRAGESLSQWLSRADRALYEAKHGGRNRSAAAP